VLGAHTSKRKKEEIKTHRIHTHTHRMNKRID